MAGMVQFIAAPGCGKVFGLGRLEGVDEKSMEILKKSYVAQVQTLWDEADARLGKTKYLAGDSLTVADILLSVIANWGLPVTLGANVKRVISEVSKRPAYQKRWRPNTLSIRPRPSFI